MPEFSINIKIYKNLYTNTGRFLFNRDKIKHSNQTLGVSSKIIINKRIKKKYFITFPHSLKERYTLSKYLPQCIHQGKQNNTLKIFTINPENRHTSAVILANDTPKH